MFARTARLMLRPGWAEDAAALARAIGYETVVSKLAYASWPYTLGDAQDFLSQPRGADVADFLIFDDPAGRPRLIGGIAIAATADGPELGYWLTPAAWGHGYATEAGRAVLGIARHALGLRRLRATPFVDNPASARVLEKLGFRATGRIEPRRSAARGAEVASALYECGLAEASTEPMPLAA